jgi:hypothetical protein
MMLFPAYIAFINVLLFIFIFNEKSPLFLAKKGVNEKVRRACLSQYSADRIEIELKILQ